MATIKAMVVEMQRQKMRSADDGTICEIVRNHLKEICKPFPNDTPEGREFSNILCGPTGERSLIPVEKAVGMLVDKCMDERNDLSAYPHLRQQIVDAINNRR